MLCQVSWRGGCVCICFMVAIGAGARTTLAQQMRTSAGQRNTGPDAKYEYGFDPYSFSGTPQGYVSRGYSQYTNLFFAPSPYSTRGSGQAGRLYDQSTSSANNQVYGYVGEEETPQAPAPSSLDKDFIYFYDDNGKLQFGPVRDIDRDQGPPREQPPQRPFDVQQETRLPPVFAPEPQVRHFNGEVTNITTVTGRTDNRLYLVVRVRQPNDTFETVQIGPLGTTRIRLGDWIEGMGTPAEVQGRPMLLARQIAVNGNPDAVGRLTTRQPRNFVGEIVETQGIYLEATHDEPQGLAQIRDNAGVVQRVLLGPVSVLRTTTIRPGTQVEVWVRNGALNGLPVLIAEQIEVNRRVIRVYYDRDRYDSEVP